MISCRWGPRPSHYALSLFAAAAGLVFSTRQVLLHILPGDPGYGTALLGHHYYTLALIAFAASIVLIAIIDRKSTRLNSSHLVISYAVFCLKKNNALVLVSAAV